MFLDGKSQISITKLQTNSKFQLQNDPNKSIAMLVSGFCLRFEIGDFSHVTSTQIYSLTAKGAGGILQFYP
jgi:hypothetical protein